jgi:hypothetical protein
MSSTQRRTFRACFGGRATGAADVRMFSLLVSVLLSTGFLHGTTEAGALAGAACTGPAIALSAGAACTLLAISAVLVPERRGAGTGRPDR